MTLTKLISADSHFTEPPDLFTSRVAADLREIAPRTWSGELPDGRRGEFFTAPGIDRRRWVRGGPGFRDGAGGLPPLMRRP